MDTTTRGCDGREPKHISLDNAIDRLREIRTRTQNLLEKIQGTVSPENDCKLGIPSQPPSLQDIIDGGPDRLNVLYDDLNDTLHRIEEALF